MDYGASKLFRIIYSVKYFLAKSVLQKTVLHHICMIIGLGRKYFLSIMYLEFIKSCPGVSTPPHDSPASDLTQVLGGWNRMRWEDVIRTALTILSIFY